MIGNACKHSEDNCLVFSSKPGAFDRTEEIRAISQEEALEILGQADREGLIHATANTQTEVNYICNCCTCSCGVLRGMVDYGNTDLIARSDFYAVVDPYLCTACEDCLNRCQFNALEMADEVCNVKFALCVGCGLCVTTCPTEALSLALKQEAELVPPAFSEAEWREKRAAALSGSDRPDNQGISNSLK